MLPQGPIRGGADPQGALGSDPVLRGIRVCDGELDLPSFGTRGCYAAR